MTKIGTLSLTVLLLGSSAAIAQPYDYGNRNEQRQVQNYEQNREQNREYENRDQNREQNRERTDQNREYDHEREVRGLPHWARGDRLPGEYRGDRYVVADWRDLHLRRPPRGYQWIHVGDRYVLAAIASGVIADLILENEIRH